MHPATLAAIQAVRAGAPDGADNPMLMLARLLAEIVEQNAEIILTLTTA